MSIALLQTPLHEAHMELGARMGAFAGWDMPIRYGDGQIAEHLAVRSTAGAFDVSHMGQIETSGAQAAELLAHLCTNDVAAIPIGGAQYGLLLNEDGGVLDDVINYRLEADRFLTVTNAANHAADFDWFRAHRDGFDAEVTDRAGDYAMIAVQGPLAREIVQAVASAPLPERMTVGTRTINGAEALVAATGYTGEDGVEILLAPDDAPAVWNVLVRRGAKPAGLAARDTLRTEACYHLYGNDLSADRGPIEAGLGWACRRGGGYIGAEAVEAARADPPPQKLVPFVVLDRGAARPGDQVIGGGVVTSGTFSPSLEQGIGLAYLPLETAVPGTEFEIDVRGKTRRARVEKRPLLKV
ncbi:MAG TPA: glycine cleavage system aminomethyltransferase GcvT [Solirubrobacteraceae bacterium]|nr:glycine cleavage system aminomethyltransferase GcvT [Solirubrobacteraceae bacterium]